MDHNKIVEDRNKVYGDIDESAVAIAILSEAFKQIGHRAKREYELSFRGHLTCVAYKLSRFLRNPKHEDSWVDLVNYLMFAWNSENKGNKFKVVFEKEWEP